MPLPNISELVSSAMERFSVRAGNGVSLQPGGVVSRYRRAGEPGTQSEPLPRAGLPDFEGGRFLFNLVPVGSIAQDPLASVARSNVKAYVKMTVAPVAYAYAGPFFDVGYADVIGLELVTTAHGNTPARVNATVSIASGAATPGTYYFYCGKLFDNGDVRGLSSAESQDDIDFFYTNITSFGWLPPPFAALHYPPIDLV